LRNAIAIIYSRGVLQPSGTRRNGNGVSQLSPLRPVLGNGDLFIEILRNALTFERVLQRRAPSHLWTTNQKRLVEGVHIAIVSGLFTVAAASTGEFALVPWGVRGLYKAPAIEHKVGHLR